MQREINGDDGTFGLASDRSGNAAGAGARAGQRLAGGGGGFPADAAPGAGGQAGAARLVAPALRSDGAARPVAGRDRAAGAVIVVPDRPDLVAAEIDGVAVVRFDARRAWDRLSPEARRAIGEAAVLAAWCGLASRQVAGRAAIAFDAAAYHGYRMLGRAATEHLGPVPEPAPRPDLAVFGIRACRRCGVTDAIGWPAGCSWVAEDLCSGCAR